MGQGAFGTVYEAHHKRTKESVAIKLFNEVPDESIRREMDCLARMQGQVRQVCQFLPLLLTLSNSLVL